jgi:hypothetical protein
MVTELPGTPELWIRDVRAGTGFTEYVMAGGKLP